MGQLLKPAARAVEVGRSGSVRDMMTQLVPQRREIGADLDGSMRVGAVNPRVATDVEILSAVLAAAVCADDDLRAGYVPDIVAAPRVAVHDGAPVGIVGGGPGRVGSRGAGATDQECKSNNRNDDFHAIEDSHLATNCQYP